MEYFTALAKRISKPKKEIPVGSINLLKFEKSWRYIQKIQAHSHKAMDTYITKTPIPMHLDILNDLLVQEEVRRKDTEDSTAGVCMEFLLKNDVLGNLVRLAIPDLPRGFRSEVMRMIANLVNLLDESFLEHKNVHNPILIIFEYYVHPPLRNGSVVNQLYGFSTNPLNTSIAGSRINIINGYQETENQGSFPNKNYSLTQTETTSDQQNEDPSGPNKLTRLGRRGWTPSNESAQKTKTDREQWERDQLETQEEDFVELMYIVSSKIHGYPSSLGLFFYDRKWEDSVNEPSPSLSISDNGDTHISNEKLPNDKLSSRRSTDIKRKPPRFQFSLFSNLLLYLHRTGKIGDYARTALLFLLELAYPPGTGPKNPSKQDESIKFEKYILDQSEFVSVVSASLVAVYSQLPSRIKLSKNRPSIVPISETEIAVEFQQATESSIHSNERKVKSPDPEIVSTQSTDFRNKLTLFTQILEFIEDVYYRTPSFKIQASVLRNLQNHFMATVLYPGILESLDSDGSSVAIMVYLEHILQAIKHHNFGKLFMNFFNGEPELNKHLFQSNNDNENGLSPASASLQFTIRDLICSNIKPSSSSDAIIAALRLLRTILLKCDLVINLETGSKVKRYSEPDIRKSSISGSTTSDTDKTRNQDIDKNMTGDQTPVSGKQVVNEASASISQTSLEKLQQIINENTIKFSKELFSNSKNQLLFQGFDLYLNDASNKWKNHVCCIESNKKSQSKSSSVSGPTYNEKTVSDMASKQQDKIIDENKNNQTRIKIIESDPLIQSILLLLSKFFNLSSECNLALTGVLTVLVCCPSRTPDGWLAFDINNLFRELISPAWENWITTSKTKSDRLNEFKYKTIGEPNAGNTVNPYNKQVETLNEVNLYQNDDSDSDGEVPDYSKLTEKSKSIQTINKVGNLIHKTTQNGKGLEGIKGIDPLQPSNYPDISVNAENVQADSSIFNGVNSGVNAEMPEYIRMQLEQLISSSGLPEFDMEYKLDLSLEKIIESLPSGATQPSFYMVMSELANQVSDLSFQIPYFSQRLKRARNALMGIVEEESDLAYELEEMEKLENSFSSSLLFRDGNVDASINAQMFLAEQGKAGLEFLRDKRSTSIYNTRDPNSDAFSFSDNMRSDFETGDGNTIPQNITVASNTASVSTTVEPEIVANKTKPIENELLSPKPISRTQSKSSSTKGKQVTDLKIKRTVSIQHNIQGFSVRSVSPTSQLSAIEFSGGGVEQISPKSPKTSNQIRGDTGSEKTGGDEGNPNILHERRNSVKDVNMKELLENIIILQESIKEIIAYMQIRRENGYDDNSIL
ncbi:hypothetical protein BB558_001157 [Smittium angustum]|uniref:Retinoic acid induced 16-like protein n=1 Tax=Smittium angustum TaxID=133377 RepID=A0A2U1JC71_SMIAN|nr:hypothetical protein BB558_001157 [Smittium angustum]